MQAWPGGKGRGSNRGAAMGRDRARRRLDWPAALLGGVAAGIVSTLVQGVWWGVAGSFPESLFRDARLAAAILMGPGVLPPPASFDLVVMGVATIVHFALSIAYGLLLALAIRSASARAALAVGAAFGLALYLVNLYGFTHLFPWFEQVRNPDTLLAHLVFGLTGAYTYHSAAIRRRASRDSYDPQDPPGGTRPRVVEDQPS